MSWTTLPIAGTITQPKTAMDNKTGTWRERRPVLEPSKCIDCLICWIYCPEPAIERLPKLIRINYDYCKGCGICATECPTKAILMEDEP